MKPTPYPHQLAGAKLIAEAKAFALWWTMRTGKTITTLEAIVELLGIRKILIVCPASIKVVWASNLDNYGVNYELYKQGRKRKAHDSLIINYESVWRDKAAVDVTKYDAVVFDESIRLQNWTTYGVQWWFANLQKLPDVRVLLSGAPCPESILQVAPQLWILRKGSAKFGNVFTNYLHSNWYYDEYTFKWKPEGSHVEPGLQKLMSKSGNHLTQQDIGVQVRKQYLQIDVEPSREQANLAKEIFKKEKVENADGETEEQYTLPGTRRGQLLAMLSSGVNAIDKDAHRLIDSPKMDALADYVGDILADYPEERFVIFTNYKLTPRVIGDKLKKFGNVVYCTGEESEHQRAESVSCFQKGDAIAIVVNAVIGKMGIDLSRGNFLLYLENNRSGDTRIQSEERATRLDKIGTVQIVDFCTKFKQVNIDAKIAEAVKDKRDFSANLLSELQ